MGGIERRCQRREKPERLIQAKRPSLSIRLARSSPST